MPQSGSRAGNKARFSLKAAIGLLVCSRIVLAEPAGEVVAVGTGPERACIQCHGMRGEGDRISVFPRLAGQGVAYLEKQLRDYADGSRPNDIMSPIARELSQEQRQSVAKYYSAQTAPYGSPVPVKAEILQQGAALAAIGARERQVPACVSCHGADGLGSPPLIPRLAGQHASYLQLQLELWQRDQRRNDTTHSVAPIAKRLRSRETKAVAEYFAAWRPHATSPYSVSEK